MNHNRNHNNSNHNKPLNTHLRDQALQIFIRHFFSVEWLRNEIAESMLLKYPEIKQNDERFIESELYYLIRLSIEFYPTATNLQKMMHLLENMKNDDQVHYRNFRIYFSGFILETMKKHSEDSSIQLLCSKIMNKPSNSFSDELCRELLERLRELNDDSNICLNDGGAYGLIITQKPEIELQRYQDDQLHFFRNLSKSLPEYLETLSNCSSFDQLLTSKKGILSLLVPYAIHCIGSSKDVSSSMDPVSMLLMARTILISKQARRQIPSIRRIISQIQTIQLYEIEMHLNRFDSFFIIVNSILLSPDETGQFIEKVHTFLIELTNQFNKLQQILRTVLPTFSISSDYWNRFKAHQEACCQSLFDSMNNSLTLFLQRNEQFLSYQRDTCSRRINCYHDEITGITIAMMMFSQLTASYPMFQEYFSSWKDRYLQDILLFQTIFLNYSDSIEFNNNKRLSNQMKQLMHFQFLQEITEFRSLIRCFLQDHEKDGSSPFDEQKVEEFLIDVLYPVVYRSHLQYRDTIDELLQERKGIFTFFSSLEEQIVLASQLQSEINRLYPNLEPTTLLTHLTWDPRQSLRGLVFNLFKQLNTKGMSNRKVIKIMKDFSSLREDILALFTSNQKINQLLQLKVSIPVELLILLLKKQQIFYEKVSSTIETAVKGLTEKKFPYDNPLANFEFACFFEVPTHAVKVLEPVKLKTISFQYQKIIGYLETMTITHPTTEPIATALMQLLVKFIPAWPVMKDKTKHDEMVMELPKRLQNIAIVVTNLKSVDEQVVNQIMTMLSWYDQLIEPLTIQENIVGVFTISGWYNLLEGIDSVIMMKFMTFQDFSLRWSSGYSVWLLMKQLEKRYPHINLESYSQGLHENKPSICMARILNKVFHLQFQMVMGLIVTLDNSKTILWEIISFLVPIVMRNETPVVIEAEEDRETINQKRLSGIFFLMKTILPSLSTIPDNVSSFPDVIMKYQEAIQYCYKQVDLFDINHYSSDYISLLIVQSCTPLIIVLDYYGKKLFHHSEDEILRRKLKTETIQRLRTIHRLLPIFQLFELFRKLCYRHPLHVMTISEGNLWKKCFPRNNSYTSCASSSSSLLSSSSWLDSFLEESERKAFTVQQLESFHSHKLLTPNEMDRIFIAFFPPFLSPYHGRKKYSDHPNSLRCWNIARECYEESCRLYFEWRSSMIESNHNNSSEIIIINDPANKKRIALIQQLNVLILSLFYANIFLNCQSYGITWTSFETEQRQLLARSDGQRQYQLA